MKDLTAILALGLAVLVPAMGVAQTIAPAGVGAPPPLPPAPLANAGLLGAGAAGTTLTVVGVAAAIGVTAAVTNNASKKDPAPNLDNGGPGSGGDDDTSSGTTGSTR